MNLYHHWCRARRVRALKERMAEKDRRQFFHELMDQMKRIQWFCVMHREER